MFFRQTLRSQVRRLTFFFGQPDVWCFFFTCVRTDVRFSDIRNYLFSFRQTLRSEVRRLIFYLASLGVNSATTSINQSDCSEGSFLLGQSDVWCFCSTCIRTELSFFRLCADVNNASRHGSDLLELQYWYCSNSIVNSN
jgi:hypothetical protein